MGSTTGVSGHGDEPRKDTQQIRGNIERTQREMSATIDEIHHRLSPDYLIQHTKESVRRAGVSTTHRFIDKVKENPLPAAMVGVGMWLLMRGDDRHEVASLYGLRDDREYDAYGDYAYDNDRNRLDRVKQQASEKVERARARTSVAVDEAKEKLSDVADTTRERAHELADTTRRAAVRTRLEARDFMSESPLVAGFVALALGAIAAAIIPETEKEDRLLGSKRDELVDRGRELAREGAERARQVAEDVKENVANETRNASQQTTTTPPVTPTTPNPNEFRR